MSLDKQVQELKKKLFNKQIESAQALIELRDMVSGVIDNLEKNNDSHVVDELRKIENKITKIKYPNLDKLVNEIKKIKPEVKIELKQVEGLLKEISKKDLSVEVNQTEIKWPQKAKDAIPVVLTDKNKKEFYNALASIASNFLGGFDTSNLANKELQNSLLEALIEIQSDLTNGNQISKIQETPPTDDTKLNPSLSLSYDGSGNLTAITKVIDGDEYVKTLVYEGSVLVSVTPWVKI